MNQATLPGQYRNSNLFSGYYLDERVDGLDEWNCDEEAERAFDKLRDLYESEDDLGNYDEAQLRNFWIDEVLEILGYEPLPETPILDARGSIDRTLHDTKGDRMDAAAMKTNGEYAGIYGQSLSVLEAKQWDADFTERFGKARSYRDASHQIKYYLEHTPESVSWGILTNGKKWRLYGTKDYETGTYYEVDLVNLLKSGSVEVFKYFYVFFRPAAFRESGGTTFLDRVWSESETAAQELGEDLQDNVFTALRVLGEGFVEKNDLAIDPAEDERLADLKEHSLVLLYRLMFVLYAESRDLIDPDDPHAAEEYEENFSLDTLRREVIDEVGERADEDDFEREFSSYSTRMWGRLEDLFALVDSGNDELGIPAYNGGLFDEDSHRFLAENEVANRHLAEVIYRLSTTETEDGYVAADYADLDTRHLGTIYEGLLEHEFAVAPEAQAAVSGDGGQVWKPADEVSVAEAVETVEEGELYVVNDDGERKATGAYYTPDYVVTYIVEETVGPLLSEIEEELEGLEPGTEEYVVAFWECVTDLKILDPAMGSGHFLTKATGYLADAVMERVRELESGSLFDEELVRRTISRECIYGVDVNGMAVELAKLSMWLETLAADQPLAFLDHHLKAGNSLVGSDITDVLAEEDEPGQVTLAYDFAQTRRRALGQVMDRMGELLAIDNETLEDVHSMEDLYAEIREDPLYEHLQAMATVHTASEFGLDVPEDAIERMARAIEDDEAWADIEATDWFRAARAMADEEGFFHWELEFPAVFFDGDGERLASAGFDAVVGNPPYFNLETTKGTDFNNYLREEYDKIYSGKADVLYFFCDRATDLFRKDGILSFIVSRYFTEAFNAKDFRERLTERTGIRKIADFGNNQIFPGVDTLTIILSLGSSENRDKSEIVQVDDEVASSGPLISSTLDELETSGESPTGSKYTVSQTDFGRERWLILPKSVRELKRSVEDSGTRLGSFCRTGQGMMTGLNEAFTVSSDEIREWNIEQEILKPLVKNGNLRKYKYNENDKILLYLENKQVDNYPNTKAYLEQYRSDLEKRAKADSIRWYRYQNPINKDLFESFDQKIICPFIATENRFYLDEQRLFNDGGDIEVIVQDGNHGLSDEYFVALLNSSLLQFYHLNHAKLKRDGFYEYFGNSLRDIPIQENPNERRISALDRTKFEAPHEALSSSSTKMADLKKQKQSINLDLLDYLGTYEDGPTLGEFYQPASGLAASVLTDTETDSEFEKLRVTGARIERDGDRLRVLAVPYVKPNDPDAYETNSRGYATLAPVPAMEFVGLSEAEADLIEAFVPHAVAEAGGFASYRDNATATISPLDRLEGLTLPTLADVEGGIERYMDARERAAELDEKIERTDELIDEIIYELYGLTDEEIEIVEEAVGE